MCVPCFPKAPLIRCTHSGGARSIFCSFGIRLLSCLTFVQITCCHQSTKKGEIIKACLSLSSFGDWWQCFCGLIVCIELFRYIMTKHKMIWCPSNIIEDGVSLRFFSVELSRRKAVLLRGGPLWKGLGGISRTHSLLHRLSSSSLECSSISPCLCDFKASALLFSG